MIRVSLRLKNISKTYQGPDGPLEVLKGVSLEVSAGEFAAVQGPSGCGKSTVLLVAGGLLSPEQGEVLIDGENPYALDAVQVGRLRAKKVGFVFQQFHLIPYLSVSDNVLAPSMAVPEDAAGARERAKEMIGHFKLTERASHLPSELSAGECQRVALARALLNQPKVLLADEPTGNLDPENGEIVLASLAEFADNGGAVLLVTHDEEAAGRAQVRFRIAEGELSRS